MNLDLSSCTLCPHMCKVNRINRKIGRCRSTANVKIALATLHHFEEPCISGKNGSGTVFFQIVTYIVSFAKIIKLASKV